MESTHLQKMILNLFHYSDHQDFDYNLDLSDHLGKIDYPKNGTSLPSSNLISQNISTISQISNLKLPQFFSPEA